MVRHSLRSPLDLAGGVWSALDLIADRWALIVISALLGSTCRYGDLQRQIVSISQMMLTQTLSKLERDGLVRQTITRACPTGQGPTGQCWRADNCYRGRSSREQLPIRAVKVSPRLDPPPPHDVGLMVRSTSIISTGTHGSAGCLRYCNALCRPMISVAKLVLGRSSGQDPTV